MGFRHFALAAVLSLCSIVSLAAPAVACEGEDFSSLGMYYDLAKSNFDMIASGECPNMPAWVAYRGCMSLWAKPYCKEMEDECKAACADSCGGGGSSSSSSSYPGTNESSTPAPGEQTLDECEAKCEADWDSRHEGGWFSDAPAAGACGPQAEAACELVRKFVKECELPEPGATISPTPSPSASP